MTTLDDYKEFFAGLRKRTGLDALEPDDAGLVSVRVQDEYNVCFRFIQPSGKILCFVEVADLPKDAGREVYRDLLATVNAREAQSLATEFPYKPGEGGVSSFRRIAAPANPAGMPQTLQERKKFLRSMLPIYHKNELPGGFDYAHNTHGRAHATRAFIFSVVMGNILKEKGVAIRDNPATFPLLTKYYH